MEKYILFIQVDQINYMYAIFYFISRLSKFTIPLLHRASKNLTSTIIGYFHACFVNVIMDSISLNVITL